MLYFKKIHKSALLLLTWNTTHSFPYCCVWPVAYTLTALSLWSVTLARTHANAHTALLHVSVYRSLTCRDTGGHLQAARCPCRLLWTQAVSALSYVKPVPCDIRSAVRVPEGRTRTLTLTEAISESSRSKNRGHSSYAVRHDVNRDDREEGGRKVSLGHTLLTPIGKFACHLDRFTYRNIVKEITL